MTEFATLPLNPRWRTSASRVGLAEQVNARHASAGSYVSHLLLRALLARAFGISPSEIKVTHMANGKPTVNLPGVQVSVTNSAQYVAASWSTDDVGIDVERSGKVQCGLSRVFLTESEISSIRDERDVIKQWVRKEALCKATGVSIAAMRIFQLTPAAENPRLLTPELAAQWAIRDFNVDKNHFGALATVCESTVGRHDGAELIEACFPS